MITDRNAHIHRQTDTLIIILRSPIGDGVTTDCSTTKRRRPPALGTDRLLDGSTTGEESSHNQWPASRDREAIANCWSVKRRVLGWSCRDKRPSDTARTAGKGRGQGQSQGQIKGQSQNPGQSQSPCLECTASAGPDLSLIQSLIRVEVEVKVKFKVSYQGRRD